MNEWWLIALLGALSLMTAGLIVYPLKHHRLFTFIFIPLTLVLSGVGYYVWGSFSYWQRFQHLQQSRAQVNHVLKTIKTPQELIQKLKAKLEETPDSAKGWYLLGRIYSSQKEFQQASQAFAKAHSLEPANEQYTVNYAYGLWQTNHQQFNPYIIGLFRDLLKNNKNQPDALSMLAMNAFQSHDYQSAIDYWKQLLAITPEPSEEADALREAIVKAQKKINKVRSRE